MPIRVKSGAIGGGSWQGPIADGMLRLKSGAIGGGSWLSPAYCKVKVGAIGGGYWQDSGYLAYPNPPSAPAVYTWNYDNVQVYWNYASGGPAIAYYEIQMLDEGGSLLNSENSTDNLSPNWGVSHDTRYQYRVRSVGANGLVSAWQGNLRIAIGHPSVTCSRVVTRTRDWWVNQVIDPTGYVNQCSCITVPSRVTASYFRANLHLNYGWTPSPPAYFYSGTRDFWRVNGTLIDKVLWPNPADFTYAWSRNTPGPVGVYAAGSGWGTSAGSVFTYKGDITASGTEEYDATEYYTCVSEVGNSYW